MFKSNMLLNDQKFRKTRDCAHSVPYAQEQSLFSNGTDIGLVGPLGSFSD